jgi:hypothetical protein
MPAMDYQKSRNEKNDLNYLSVCELVVLVGWLSATALFQIVLRLAGVLSKQGR